MAGSLRHAQNAPPMIISEPLQRVLLHRPGAAQWRHAGPGDPRGRNPWKIRGNLGKSVENPWKSRDKS